MRLKPFLVATVIAGVLGVTAVFARPKGECAFCHIANAKKDDIWTQFYLRLDH